MKFPRKEPYTLGENTPIAGTRKLISQKEGNTENRANSGVGRRACQGKSQPTDQGSRHGILGAIQLFEN
jgi:hypothetical protein